MICLVNIPAGMGGGAHKDPHLVEKLEAVGGCQGRKKSVFLRGKVLKVLNNLPMLQWTALHPCVHR